VLVLALILSACAVGLSNFAAAIGIGLSGVDARMRWRVAVVFGVFEAGMPMVGLFLGHHLAHTLGQTTRYAGGSLLIAAGIWVGGQARRPERPTAPTGYRTGRLILAGLALSLDNLVVGFGLGVTRVPLAAALVVFGVVSVGLSLAGLELGSCIGARVRADADVVAGLVLVGVGALIAAGVL